MSEECVLGGRVVISLRVTACLKVKVTYMLCHNTPVSPTRHLPFRRLGTASLPNAGQKKKTYFMTLSSLFSSTVPFPSISFRSRRQYIPISSSTD